MVEGAVPGAKGGWITVRDAVKKTLPKEAPKPGKFRVGEAAEAKPETKPEAKPETTPEAKAEAKPETKVEAKPATQSETKPADAKASEAASAPAKSKKKKEGA